MTPPTGHSYTVGRLRGLSDHETALLIAMLSANPKTVSFVVSLAGCLVHEMNDGGMGSLRFVGVDDRKFGSITAEAEFPDDDGIPVSAAVIIDQYGELYELDI